MLSINVRPREKGNVGKLRKSGNIPGVYYGPGKPSTMVSMNALEFDKLLAKAGESSVISLATDTGSLDALIHDVEHDPVTGTPIHVDFYLVAKDRKIQVNVPIEFIGVAPVERIGGAVVKVMHEVRVEALPSELPQHVTIDLAVLTELHSHVALKDLVLPGGVKIVGNPSDTIVGVTAQHEEKEEVPVEPDLSAIEVEKKGKEEEEGAGDGAGAEAPAKEK